MLQKFSYLSNNIILFTISSFAPKILAFLFVPLYTSTLTTAEYGIGDVITATASLALPILTVCIGSAVLRFCYDADFTYQEVFSNTLLVFLKGFFVLLVLLLFVAFYPSADLKLSYLIALSLIFFSHGLYEIITNFARGIDKVRVLVEMSIISTASTCGLNLILLLILRFGLDGFLIANYLGVLISCFYGFLRLNISQYILFGSLNARKREVLLKFSFPLVFNRIGWWINSASARYIITWLLGFATNGIFTVAYKIPTILTACSDIFAQAWQLSAIREFDKNDSDHFISNLYNSYNAFLVLCCSALILLSYPIALFLYAKEFFIAWEYVPPLLMSVIFGGLSGFFGSIFIAIKDTKIFTISTIAGGITNIILTVVLIHITQSAMGAALAALCSSIVIWGIRATYLRRYIFLDIPYVKHGFMYCTLFLQFLISLRGFEFAPVFLQLFVLLFLVFIMRKEFIVVIKKIYEISYHKFRS